MSVSSQIFCPLEYVIIIREDSRMLFHTMSKYGTVYSSDSNQCDNLNAYSNFKHE